MRRRLLPLAALLPLLSACPCGSSSPDAGDGGGGVTDAGPPSLDGGCADEGQSCISVPCCNLQDDVCSPAALNTCSPILDIDAGPAAPDSGPSDAGQSDGGQGDAGPPPDGGAADAGPPDGGPYWVADPVMGSLAAIDDLAAPPLRTPLAVGAGTGQGGLLARDAGSPSLWLSLAATPPTAALFGVWEDAVGDVAAAGVGLDGGAALLVGSLDGGLALLTVSSLADVLLGVVGIGPGELLASGRLGGGAALLHVRPDGGIVADSIPAGLVFLHRLRGSSPTFALGGDGAGNPELLERTDAGWVELPATGAANLSDLAIGPTGELVVAGDDGQGDGLAYRFSDGGFTPIDLSSVPGGAPPVTAIFEAAPGDLTLAAVAPSSGGAGLPPSPEIIHLVGGTATLEPIPNGVLQLNVIAGDASGARFAAGSQRCQGCASAPLILHRLP
ncbi:MAG: hypothetical protein ACYCWW_04190 [Deltaproteobacteria bacterium]